MSDLPDTAMETLRLLPSTQHEIDRFSDMLIQAVKDGEVSALEILVQFTAMDKVMERIKKETKQEALKEADLHPERTFSFMGNQVEKAEVGVRYDYDGTGDKEYLRLKEAVKAKEVFLKSLTAPISIVDKDSGEVVGISPPKKNGSTGLKISLR